MKNHMLIFGLILLSNPLLTLCQEGEEGTEPPSTPAVNASTTTTQIVPYLHVLIHRIENLAGTLKNQNPCSDFAFAGAHCSIHLQFCAYEANESNDTCDLVDFGVVGVGSNEAEMEEGLYNNVQNPITVSISSYFQGFNFKIVLTNQNDILINEWTGNVPQSYDTQGVGTFYSPELTQSVQLAWKTNNPSPVPTTPGTTKSTVAASTIFTTNSVDTTTLYVPEPSDCEDIPTRINGNYTIYPDGTTPVTVFCTFSGTDELSVALTVIQSRSRISSPPFQNNDTTDGYVDQFGVPTGNFWFGLDNMNVLSNKHSFNLRIDVCCAGQKIETQNYKNFRISDKSTNYTLNAISIIANKGLATTNINSDGAETDIGAQFHTFTELSNEFIENCDILYDFADTKNFAETGGWWFGSCTNNLNAPQPDKYDDDDKCSVKPEGAQYTNPGIELRTFSSKPVDTTLDDISYDKVVMAIYRSDKTILDLNLNLCDNIH